MITMLTMNRFPTVWFNNLLIVVAFLFCFTLPSNVITLDYLDDKCPSSIDEDNYHAICRCEEKDVRCRIGKTLTSNATFWSDFANIKSPYSAIYLSIDQSDSSNLTYFPTKLFSNLPPSIEEITLSSWKFSSIPDFRVPLTSKVKSLTIVDSENFTTIGPKAFSPLSVYLERLQLTSNKLNSIDSLAFRGLKNVREVKLLANNLTSLPDNLFLDSIKLTNLSLSNNAITLLTRATFRGLSNLRELELDHNELFTIMDNTFLELASLRSLDLSYNKINSLGQLAFNGLISVEFIDLSTNQLQNLPPLLLTHTPKLTEIDLKHNQLNLLDDNFLKQLPKTIFLKDNEWNCNCNLVLYQDLLLLDNRESKCTTSSDEFNKSNKPVKPLEVTFEQYISHHQYFCNEINVKAKRSHLSAASTSSLVPNGSGCILNPLNFIILMIVCLITFMIVNVSVKL